MRRSDYHAEVTMLGEGARLVKAKGITMLEIQGDSKSIIEAAKDIENCTKSVFKENFEVSDMRHWYRECIRRLLNSYGLY